MKKLPELDERKQIILKNIIKTYLETGEPVGSRTISRMNDLNLSSATIRNEMSDLEEMGYIMQPHASAGRIPSDKGYRFYVDNLIVEKQIEIENIKAEMFDRVDKLENLLKEVVKTVANNTNYAALISGPDIMKNKIKYIQISNLEEKRILIVVILEGNVVKTHIIESEKEVSPKEILDISIIINNLLTGKTIQEIEKKSFKEEVNKITNNKEEILLIIEGVKKAFWQDNKSNSIYTSGANNFFRYKELADDNENIQNLVETFEHKDELANLIENIGQETGIKIYIGQESSISSMKDCSVVTANCDFGNGMKGMLGVVGPKRMDYEKVIKTLINLTKNMGDEFS